MSRLSSRLDALRTEGRKALIPYITGGDPDMDTTVPLMHAMVESGADILEVGVAFSDPMADGPVIQAACERALAAGATLRGILALVEAFRAQDDKTPVVLMGYLNPVEAMGYETFARAAADAGVDGVLLVDLAPEEADALVPIFRDAGLDMIFLVAPTTTEARLSIIAEHASGYLYYVSLKGVTGSAALNVEEVAARVNRLKSAVSIPVAVGFGIRDAESARQVSAVADGVVVGSALVGCIAEQSDDRAAIVSAITDKLAAMRSAMDTVS